jgi:uncharacterized membrane protein YeaQ/YmgE (transglycosylase-associated protein family)
MPALLVWIIVGAIGGWLAGYAMHRNTALSLWDIVLGMVGAVVGGWLASTMFGVATGGLDPVTIFVAFVGAVIVAWLYEAVTGRAAQ